MCTIFFTCKYTAINFKTSSIPKGKGGKWRASETLTGVTQLKIGDVCLFIYLYICMDVCMTFCTLTLAFLC